MGIRYPRNELLVNTPALETVNSRVPESGLGSHGVHRGPNGTLQKASASAGGY
jgi:hypothetical protein